jgi:hypothetical protein
LTFGYSSSEVGWETAYKEALASQYNIETYFVPAFLDAPVADFYQNYPVADGAFNWNSWPTVAEGKIPVYTRDDVTFMDDRGTNNTFMVRLFI